MSEQRPSRAFFRKARRSLRRMTDLQREVFLAMRFEESVTYAQLAKRHGLTESEVQHAFASALFIFAKSIRKPEPWWWRLWPWWPATLSERWLAIARLARQGRAVMRSDLDHLPPAKQRELERVVQIIFEEFGAAHENATSRRKRGRILKVILYGSHARGGWVDEPHTAKGYVSDFDLLIIVNQKELTDRAAYWTSADQRLIEEKLAGRLRTPVNFVIHSWQEVGDALAHGRFFFLDIARDGVVLQEVDDRPLPEPKPKTPQQALAMAKEYYEEWYPSALRAHVNFGDDLKRGWHKDAAFMLHQATERLYHCVLLVSTFYTPLCRARHNGVYAERQTMPMGA